MHWCLDETLALLAAIPYIGYVFSRCHAWWHVKFHHPCHEKHCEEEHVEHTHTHTSTVECKSVRNPVTLKERAEMISWSVSLNEGFTDVYFNGKLMSDEWEMRYTYACDIDNDIGMIKEPIEHTDA